MKRVLRLLGLVLLSGCAAVASSSTPATQPGGDIDSLAADYWELRLQFSPRLATSVGDHRFDDRLDDVTPTAIASHFTDLRALLLEVQQLDGNTMSADQRVTRDVMIEAMLAEAGTQVCEEHLWRVDHLDGLPVQWAGLASQQPLDTILDIDKLSERYRATSGVIGQTIVNLRAGLARDLVAPRIVVERQIQQLDQMLAVPIEKSSFVPETKLLMKAVPKDGEWARGRLAAMTKQWVYPALTTYRDFLRETVLPKARAKPGISQLSLGPACYLAQIRVHTGLQLAPDEIHRIGLTEVERIDVATRAVMAKIRAKDRAAPMALPDFVAYLAKRSDQHVTTREALLQSARAIVTRAQAALPKAFGVLPKTPLEVRPLEAYRERESPAAYYFGAPKDGARPGLYLLNTYEPETRYLFDAEALAFHESVPGHHLQVALAQELPNVPEFRRQDGGTAFVEGWALYAEALAKELGLYSSDETEFGRLGAESWRAWRLVIDTGIHVYGWSRDDAIARLRQGSTSSLPEITNEVDRYIAWPGQALGYKLGELHLWRLRRLAESKLGAAFKLAEFHDLVHAAGAMPMNVLTRRVEQWIGAKQTQGR